jgi:surface polysaccharide O-acyltransferase-like enzyme
MDKVGGDRHVEYIDVLRVLSMLSVVFLHTAAGSLRGNYGSAVWHFSNATTAIMSTSVPIFFMISGALLLNSSKTLSVGYTLKKRLPKVLMPFLIWSFTAVAYYAVLSYRANGAVDLAAMANRLLYMPSRATTAHLWFMYALIPLYVLSPILKKLVDSLDDKLAKYMLGIWIIFSSILPTAAGFMPEAYRPLLVLNSEYNLSFMTGYAGYFLAGYYLMNLKMHISKKLLLILIAADTVIISAGTWWKTAVSGSYSEMFKSYGRIFVLLLSVAVFLLIREVTEGRKLPGVVSKAVSVLSDLSFGVYLIHNLLVDLLSRKLNLWPSTSILTIVIAYIAVLAASLACIFALARIKPLCFIFTGLRYKGLKQRVIKSGISINS